MEKLDFLKKIWSGKKIISISNGFQTDPKDNSIRIGKVTDVIGISKSNTPVPIVKYDDCNEEYIVMSTVIEYSDKMWELLNQFNAEERWTLIRAIVERF